MKSNFVFFIAVLFFSVFALAEEKNNSFMSNVAVVDVNMALMESKKVRSEMDKFNKSIEKSTKELKAKEKSLEDMRAKLSQPETLSPSKREELEKSYKELFMAYNQEVQGLQEKQKTHERDLLKEMMPIMEEALGTIAKEDGYSIVLHINSVAFAVEKNDITNKLINLVNKMTK